MARNQQERAVIDLVINGQQAKTSLKEVSLEVTRTYSALQKMKEADNPELYKAKLAEYQKLVQAQRDMRANINSTTTAWMRFKKEATTIAAGVVGGDVITSTLQRIVGLVPAAIAQYRAFNAASQELSAVTGATGRDLAYLNQQAARMGPAMGKSGEQMLEAFKLMASAKPELLDQKELLVETTKAAITLAQAGKIDLAEATKVTAESLNQFGAPADQANRYINAIAAGAKEGSAEINEMSAALKNSGTVAAAQGVSFEQTNALLQSLSTIALKGGEAGTQLRNVLLTLGSGSDETNPKVVGLEKALENLGDKNLSTAELTKLFGKENITAAQHILTHRNEISELTSKVTGTQEAFSQATKNNATFDHQLEVFWARISGLGVLLGTTFIPTLTRVVEQATNLTKLLTDGLTPASERATQAFEEQRTKVQDLQKNLSPLLDRHDQLKAKTVLTKDEQAELKTIIGQVADIVPSAATGFDKYGSALDINTQKGREFIRVQKELLKYTNRTALEETESELSAKKKEQTLTQARLNSKTVTEWNTLSMGGGYKSRVQTDAEQTALREKLTQLAGEISDLEARKTGLNGDYLNTVAKPTAPVPSNQPTGTGGGKGNGPTDEEKKKQKEIVDANKEAQSAIAKNKAESEAEGKARDLARVQYEADQEKKRVQESKANATLKATWIKAIDDKLLVDKNDIEDKYTLKLKEEEEKRLDALRKAAVAELELKKNQRLAAIEYELGIGNITEEEAKKAKLKTEESFLNAKLLLTEAHYQALITLFKDFEDKKYILEQDRKASADQTAGEIAQNEGDQAVAKRDIALAETKTTEEEAEKQKQIEKQKLDKKKEIFNDSVTVLKTYFKENTIAYRAAFIAQQAYALGEVAFNYSKAVTGAMASAAGLPFPGNILAFAKAVAIPTIQTAAAVANIRAQKFDVPAFADGGFSNPEGFVGRATMFAGSGGPFLAGEAGTEFIVNNRALQQPVVANFVRMLDGMQKSSNYSALSTAASYGTDNNSAFGVGSDTKENVAMSNATGMAILAELRANREQMAELNGRPLDLNYRLLEQYEGNLQEIRAGNTL